MKLKDFLTALGKKSNADLTKADFADILKSDVDIPQELADTIERALMNEEAAKNNAKIKAAVKAEVYNGIDSDIDTLLEELGVDETVGKSVKEQKKTVDKLKSLATHYKAEAEKASKKGNTADAEALRTQVTELNNRIKGMQTDSQKTIDQLKADNENNLTDYEVQALLATKQYALPDQMKPTEKVRTAHGILKDELAAKGLKLVRENGSVILRKIDGTEAFDDKNNKMELTSFADGALAQRGLLKQSDPNKPEGNDPPPPKVPGAGDVVLPKAVTSAMSNLDTMIAAASTAQ
jgi:hypothetical protein